MTEFRKGDVVTVRGTIEYIHKPDAALGIGERNISIKLDGYFTSVILAPRDLTFVHRLFKVGERVTADGGDNVGIVRAVNGQHAWVEYGDAFYTMRASELEDAPEAAAESEEAA